MKPRRWFRFAALLGLLAIVSLIWLVRGGGPYYFADQILFMFGMIAAVVGLLLWLLAGS